MQIFVWNGAVWSADAQKRLRAIFECPVHAHGLNKYSMRAPPLKLHCRLESIVAPDSPIGDNNDYWWGMDMAWTECKLKDQSFYHQ